MEEGEKEYMLQIQHICKEYRTGNLVQKALDDVSLNLRDNEFVAILGNIRTETGIHTGIIRSDSYFRVII